MNPNNSEPPKPYSFDIMDGDLCTFWCSECGYENGEYIEDRGFIDDPRTLAGVDKTNYIDQSCIQCGGGPVIKVRKKPNESNESK